MDLSKYSSAELHELRKDIDKELNARRREDQKEAKRELKNVAERYGFALDELIAGVSSARNSARSKGPAAFRHPDIPGKTWTGRGRKPNWVKDWEAKGGTLDDLRVG